MNWAQALYNSNTKSACLCLSYTSGVKVCATTAQYAFELLQYHRITVHILVFNELE